MNTWVIARTTFGDSLRKRVLLVFLLIAFVMLTLALLLNYFTTREQSTIFKSTQLTIVLIFGALIAITTAVFLVPNEIERRTIYSVLAKPVERWEFFLGKFLGGALTVAFMVGLMAVALSLVLFVLAAKPPTSAIDQAAATGVNIQEWMQRGGAELALVWRAILVMYFQLLIVLALAMSFSLFLSPTVNFSLTALLWVAGNLQSLLRLSEGDGPLAIPGRVIYHILPHFHDFNIMGSIIHPQVHFNVNHWVYAAQLGCYSVCYSLVVLMLGVLAFDRKEF